MKKASQSSAMSKQARSAHADRARLLLVPLLVCDMVVIIGLAYGALQSFGIMHETNTFAPTLDNYIEALTTDNLVESIVLSLYCSTVSTTLSVVLAVVITYCLVATGHDRGPLYNFLKVPNIIPWAITAFLFVDLLGGNGVLANIARSCGLPGLADAISQTLYAPNSIGIICAFTWSSTAFVSYFISSVMTNITESLGEAASCMGASSTQVLFHVTLPLCKNSIRNAAIICFVGAFSGYEIPLLMGMTVPNLLPVEIYTRYTRFGLAGRPQVMALCIIMMLLSLAVVICIYLGFSCRRNKESGEGAKTHGAPQKS